MSSMPGADIYHNDIYLNNNASWHEEDASIKAEEILSLLQKHNVRYRTVCEVGCGSGEILVCLSKKIDSDVTFYGYDISAAAINILRKMKPISCIFLRKILPLKIMFPFMIWYL